jgi:hypothetical protein
MNSNFFFLWTDKQGVPVTMPRGYMDCIDTAGIREEAGRTAWHMVSRTMDQLKDQFGFQDHDFQARRVGPWRWQC